MDPIDRRLMLGAAGFAGVAAFTKLASPARGGPLDPPAGPISPTGRTTGEVFDRVEAAEALLRDRIVRTDAGIAEPRIPVQSLPGSATATFVISQPGSYCLTGNIQGAPKKNAIEVTASDVTLDLGGHAVVGAGAAGIISVGVAGGILVRNGVVRECGTFGVDLQGADGNGFGSAIHELRCSANCGTGIRVRYGVVESCVVSGSGGDGIFGVIAKIRNCWTGLNHGGSGISAGFGSLIEACTAHGNGHFDGIFGYGGTTITRCVADGNARAGIGVGHECLVVGNTTRGSSWGIFADNDANRIEDNNVCNPGSLGIFANGSGNCVIRNSVRGATTPYQISPGNSHGPIVNVAGVGDISSVPNANHPWANFVY